MSHEIESFAYAGEQAWHGLGERLDETRLFDVEYLKAHPALAWTCEKLPLFLQDGRQAATSAIVRNTDRKILGEVGPDYTIVQNAQVIDWFRPFLETKAARAECLGSLRGGSRVYMLARFNGEAEVVKGDAVTSHLLLAHAHDGSMVVNVGFTPIRVVCANTLRMAQDDARSKLLRLRHTQGVHAALDVVQKTIDVASKSFTATIEQYKALAGSKCTDATLDQYVKVVFATRARVAIDPVRVAAPQLRIAPSSDADRIAGVDGSRVEALAQAEAEAEAEASEGRILPRVRELFQSGRGTQIEGVRGTMWGAYNAVSEYVQHERGRNADRRLDEALFGPLVQRATDVAVSMAKAA